MKDEFVECFEVTIQVNWLQKFILRLGVVDNYAKSLRIYYDSFIDVFFRKRKLLK
jgi:energy-converting hydrogenase A subunit M